MALLPPILLRCILDRRLARDSAMSIGTRCQFFLGSPVLDSLLGVGLLTSAQRCTRSRRARAASRRRSQHGDFGHLLGWAEAVLDQPADVKQATQRPPRPDEAAV